MLCDHLVVDKVLPKSYDGLDKVFRRIVLAQKFVLSKDFSTAADGLVDNLDELRKIMPYCRLPYPRMWVEWLHDDRPHWDQKGPYKARPVDKSRHQLEPLRCGFLLEEGNTPQQWRGHLFWSLKEVPEFGETSFNGSLASIIIDVGKPEGGEPFTGKFELADFGDGLLSSLPGNVVTRLAEYALEDWGGELRFMIAMLGLLNARNVTQTESIDKEKHNIKRKKQGKPPLFSHTLLKIRPQIIRASGESVEHRHRDLRLHFVRGHFKHRKEGLLWWGMHTRGSGKHGVIDKDYVV
jgi:hypothetical protein